MKFYQSSLAEVLTGQTSAEVYDHARTESWSYGGMLAAQVDLGNQETIAAVRNILLGEQNTAMLSHELIRGIVMSKSKELYQLLGDLPFSGQTSGRCQTGSLRNYGCRTAGSLFMAVSGH